MPLLRWLLLFVPLFVHAAVYDEYGTPRGPNAVDAYHAVKWQAPPLPGERNRRSEFYRLMADVYRLDEGNLDRLFQDPRMTRVGHCPNPCLFEVAGYRSDTHSSDWWRRMQPGDEYVEVYRAGTWVPIFRRACVNPIRLIRQPLPPCRDVVWYTPDWDGFPVSHHRCIPYN